MGNLYTDCSPSSFMNPVLGRDCNVRNRVKIGMGLTGMKKKDQQVKMNTNLRFWVQTYVEKVSKIRDLCCMLR